MPKISFDDPLPLGIESEAEYMRILVSTRHQCDNIVEGMDAHLPDGVQIMDCQLRSEAKRESVWRVQRFSIQLKNQNFAADVLNEFDKSESWPYVRTNHKGRVHHIDLKKVIEKIVSNGRNTLVYDISPNSEYTIRPADILVGIFKRPTELLQDAKVLKLDPLSAKSAVDI